MADPEIKRQETSDLPRVLVAAKRGRQHVADIHGHCGDQDVVAGFFKGIVDPRFQMHLCQEAEILYDVRDEVRK